MKNFVVLQKQITLAAMVVGGGLLSMLSLHAEELEERLLQAHVAYSSYVQAMALEKGRELTQEEITLAKEIGIKHPQRVRVLIMDHVPMPQDPYLRVKLDEIGFLEVLSRARGTTKGYGIVLTPRATGDWEVMAHELIHVEQYERFGGIEATQRYHLVDLIAKGYRGSELEDEAFTRAAELIEAKSATP